MQGENAWEALGTEWLILSALLREKEMFCGGDVTCFRGMDNNSNHTSVFLDARRYAKHFECIVSFNPPATLCGSCCIIPVSWKKQLRLSKARQFTPSHTAK